MTKKGKHDYVQENLWETFRDFWAYFDKLESLSALEKVVTHHRIFDTTDIERRELCFNIDPKVYDTFNRFYYHYIIDNQLFNEVITISFDDKTYPFFEGIETIATEVIAPSPVSIMDNNLISRFSPMIRFVNPKGFERYINIKAEVSVKAVELGFSQMRMIKALNMLNVNISRFLKEPLNRPKAYALANKVTVLANGHMSYVDFYDNVFLANNHLIERPDNILAHEGTHILYRHLRRTKDICNLCKVPANMYVEAYEEYVPKMVNGIADNVILTNILCKEYSQEWRSHIHWLNKEMFDIVPILNLPDE